MTEAGKATGGRGEPRHHSGAPAGWYCAAGGGARRAHAHAIKRGYPHRGAGAPAAGWCAAGVARGGLQKGMVLRGWCEYPRHPRHPRRMSKRVGRPGRPPRAKKAAHLCPSKAKAARNGHPGRWVGRQSVSEPIEEPQRRRRNNRDTRKGNIIL